MALYFLFLFANILQFGSIQANEYNVMGMLNGKLYETSEYTASVSSGKSSGSVKSSSKSSIAQTLTISTWTKDGNELSVVIRDIKGITLGNPMKIDANGRIIIMASIGGGNSSINYGMGGTPYIGAISSLKYDKSNNTLSFVLNAKIGSFLSKGKILEIKSLKFNSIKLKGQKIES